MPNWCTTDMIVNSDEQKIHKLYNLISDWVNTSNSLLLNIVIKSGIDECDQNGNFKNGTECRGTLCDFYEFDDGFLHLQFENAWEPMFGMWFKIFDKYNVSLNNINLMAADQFITLKFGEEVYEN